MGSSIPEGKHGLTSALLAERLQSAGAFNLSESRSGAELWLLGVQASHRGQHNLAAQLVRLALARLEPSEFDDASLTLAEDILWRAGFRLEAAGLVDARLRAAWLPEGSSRPRLAHKRAMFISRQELFSLLAARSLCVIDLAGPASLERANGYDFVARTGDIQAASALGRQRDIHVLMADQPIGCAVPVRMRIAFALRKETWRAFCADTLEPNAQDLFGDEGVSVTEDVPHPERWDLPRLSPAALQLLQLVVSMICCSRITVIGADGAECTIPMVVP